jgi:biopolymer transport protein ExbD
MNLRKKDKFNAEISTGSLSDIMFFLMLFFLIASTMISPSVIKLTLPYAKHHQTIRKTEIAVSITKELKYFVNNKEITFGQIEPELARLTKGLNDVTVVIRCDNTLPIQELVNVLQIGNKMRIKMILATKAPNG